MYPASLPSARSSLCIAVLAVVSFIPCRAIAAGDSLFTFRFGSKAEVVADGDEVRARFPIVLKKGIVFDSLTLEKAGVRRGDTTSEAMHDAFEVALVTGSEELAQGLEVTVDLSGGLEAGTYKVGIDVAGAKETRQTEDLQVVIPAATLASSLENLKINRVVDRIFFLDVSPIFEPGALVLAETGGKSRVRAEAAQISLIDDKNQPVEGLIELTPPGVIGPGKSGSATISSNSRLPLGTVTGKLQIRAPELAAPKTISFTVLTRRGYFWIFFSLALGVFIGHLVRVRLQAGAARREAEVQAYTLQEKMHEAKEKNENREIAGDLQALMSRLEAAVQSGDAAEITKQIPLVDAEFRKLVDALTKRRVEVLAASKSFEAVLKTAWQLPTEIQDQVDTISDRLPEATELIRECNVSGAEAKMESLRSDLVAGAMESAGSWRLEARSLLNKYQEHKSLLLDVVASGLGNTTVGPALKALADLPLDPARPATAEVLLGKIHDAERECAQRTDLILEELRAFCDYLREELAGVSDRLLDPEPVARFETAYSDLIEVANESATWQSVLEQVTEHHAVISSSLQSALAAQLAGVEPKDLASKTKIHEALQAIKQLPVKGARPKRRMGLTGDKNADGSVAWIKDAPWRHHPRATLLQLVEADEAPRLAPHPSVLKAQSKAELKRIMLKQTIISAALIGLVGFFIYQGDFVGTWTEMAKIFFWGFGLDLGFDKVLALATSKIK